MNNCAVICEYNPFHSGHLYQLDAIRARLSDNVICVMSGQFVQSGMPAFCDKALRAECAILGGADAVIELPAVYATAGAQYFAEGAVKIISAVKDIKTIAMGATVDPDRIKRIADIKIAKRCDFKALLKRNMKAGKSYNAASVAALCELCANADGDGDVYSVLCEPNNMLCVEYICASAQFAPNIEPLIIMRKGALHGTLDTDMEHVSATAIRNAVTNGQYDAVKRYLPINADKIHDFFMRHAPDIDLYKNIAVFALKCKTVDEISRLRDCSEGMEHLLGRMTGRYAFDDYVNAIVGKRYGKKRIYRLFLDAVLGIENGMTEHRFCTRLLACKNGFDFSLLPDFVKTNNAEIKTAAENDTQTARVLAVDERAVKLYNTLCRINGDYYNYSLVKM